LASKDPSGYTHKTHINRFYVRLNFKSMRMYRVSNFRAFKLPLNDFDFFLWRMLLKKFFRLGKLKLKDNR
jgi:hypothetical protein